MHELINSTTYETTGSDPIFYILTTLENLLNYVFWIFFKGGNQEKDTDLNINGASLSCRDTPLRTPTSLPEMIISSIYTLTTKSLRSESSHKTRPKALFSKQTDAIIGD